MSGGRASEQNTDSPRLPADDGASLGGVLPPETAERIAALSVEARRAGDSMLSGHHRSRRHGSSAVFVEHRAYRPGDDPRRLDWRAFARTDRPIVKHFEQEAQLRASLALDRSESMRFFDPGSRSAPGRSKLEHGATILAALAYILSRQGDAFGLHFLDAEHEHALPARSRADHLEGLSRALVEALDGASPEKPRGTDLHRALGGLVELSGRRGVVAIASDFLSTTTDDSSDETQSSDGVDAISHALAMLGRRGHHLIIFHILTRTELELDVDSPARFEAIETSDATIADPDELRDDYRARVDEFCRSIRDATLGAGGSYVLTRPDDPTEDALARALLGAETDTASPYETRGRGRA